ncbi:MAG: tol-pal system protein YbgF [Pseudomonadota bacterium]
MKSVKNSSFQREYFNPLTSTAALLLAALFFSFFWGCGGSEVRPDKTTAPAPPAASPHDQTASADHKPWNEEAITLADLDAKVRKTGTYLDREIGTLRSEVDALKKTAAGPGPVVAATAAAGPEQAAASSPPGPSGPPLTPRQVEAAYAAGRNFYEKGDFEQAARVFSQIVGQAPRDKLAPNAVYWLGECFYSRGRYREAIQEFERTVQLYPQSPKAADATLKIAYSHSRLGSGPEAMITLRDLLFKYPKSSAARMVREGKSIFPNQ